MSEIKITALYNHFKNTPKKLKIVCDWDEVIQACEPYASWKAIDNPQKADFSYYFKYFWNILGNNNNQEEVGVEYSPYGSRLKKNSLFDREIEIKNSPDFYQQAPFLTIANK